MINEAYLLGSAAGKQWNKIGVQHHHGLNIPLFALHSQNSYGIGEYPDLIPIIRWCQSLGLKVIQLLPVNDTGLESSPYSSLSAYALNPIYLGLSQLPFLNHFPTLLEELKTLPRFSNLSHVDYEKVREMKYEFLRHYYKEAKLLLLAEESFQKFASETVWLKGYSVFKTLKIQHAWKGWDTWPQAYQNPTPELINQLAKSNEDEVLWHSVIQFLCDQQLKLVRTEADKCGVSLMGDIPILINRDSADVWLHPEIFNLQYSAGAPPDAYCSEGQNWGFPTYNWEKIAEEKFTWWIERIDFASRYFHICRIDHIVGFYRIWSIPYGQDSSKGFFIPQDPNLWIDHGQKIMLMMLKESDMLLIGEDLGTIPPEVRTCLTALGICGTRVMRWERNWNGDRQFISLQNYPIDSLTTVSTHDSQTLSEWWQINQGEAEDYARYKGWTYHPQLSRDNLKEILWDSHHTSSLFHINLLQEYLALIPGLTHPNLEDERINIPGTVNDKNWTYRFIPSVEELESNSTLRHVIKDLIV